MAQGTGGGDASKTRSRVWLPFVGCVLGVVVGRQVGKYTSAAFGFQIPPLPAGVPTSLYDGRSAGGIYGGIGAFLAGWIVISLGNRWLALRNPWLALGISLVAGALLAAAGAYMEGIPPR